MSRVALQAPSDKVGRWYVSQAAEETEQVATGRFTLHRIIVSNSAGAARWVWVFDNTAASGTVLCGPFLVASAGQLDIEFPTGIVCETGIHIASSSTQATFTGSGGNDFRMTVGFMPCTSRKDQ